MSMNPQVKDWRGQRVWIVGASSGIGLALAQKMADLGALVAVSARKQQPLTEFCQQYPHCLALPLDVNHAEQWQNSLGLTHFAKISAFCEHKGIENA